ncbi:MAG: hypothetical protein H6684_14350 [Deltaproteobacteria bacterium]|nr:hypothetical protein [Deltaproteobacteria bacterium]MCB9489910.1 hypothetical protein [Deltaproteobacteria bacterium]
MSDFLLIAKNKSDVDSTAIIDECGNPRDAGRRTEGKSNFQAGRFFPSRENGIVESNQQIEFAAFDFRDPRADLTRLDSDVRLGIGNRPRLPFAENRTCIYPRDAVVQQLQNMKIPVRIVAKVEKVVERADTLFAPCTVLATDEPKPVVGADGTGFPGWVEMKIDDRRIPDRRQGFACPLAARLRQGEHLLVSDVRDEKMRCSIAVDSKTGVDTIAINHFRIPAAVSVGIFVSINDVAAVGIDQMHQLIRVHGNVAAAVGGFSRPDARKAPFQVGDGPVGAFVVADRLGIVIRNIVVGHVVTAGVIVR